MEAILITGAGGRIGTLLRRHWQGSYRLIGADKRAYAKTSEGETPFWTAVQHPELRSAFTAAGEGATIVHLAAETWDTAGWEAILHSNIEGTANVFRLAQEHRARRVIFASTNHVTGGYEPTPPPGDADPEYKPPERIITPELPIRPDSLYGASKAFGEALGAYYSQFHSLPTICLRIGSVTDEDDPRERQHMRYRWLSHRDLCHLFDCCLKTSVQCGIYYGVSANARRFWDISNAERELGYHPQDDAETWYTEGGARADSP